MGIPEKILDSSGFLWQRDVPLKKLCHWEIGGPVDYFVEPKNDDEVMLVRKIAFEYGVPFLVIGHGSNMLFDDAGYRGIVVKLGSKFAKVSINGNHVRAEAGIWMPLLAKRCAARGLAGLEHTVGIPGNFGGLVFMNGGSLRKNIGDVITNVKILNEDGKITIAPSSECEFSYRHSIFQHTNDIILGAELLLPESNAGEVRRTMLAVMKERRGKFPLNLPNCGSVFSNDTDLYAAYGPPGMVIDRAGLKGLRVGDAEVSRVHANFIVNLGNATSADVFELVKLVREKIFDITGFTLRCEVRYASPDGKCDSLEKFL